MTRRVRAYVGQKLQLKHKACEMGPENSPSPHQGVCFARFTAFTSTRRMVTFIRLILIKLPIFMWEKRCARQRRRTQNRTTV